MKISNDRAWKQADGKIIAIDQMDDRHLLNSIRMLERNAPVYKERLLSQGYQALSFVQGEQTEWDIEHDIGRLEEQDPAEFLHDTFPVYENMLALAKERKIKL